MTPRFANNWASGERSVSSDAAAVDDAVKQIAAQAAAQGGTYAQLLFVHDWLTKNNVYNLTAAENSDSHADYDYLPWCPLSALTDVSQPVCEGYAEAFKLICDELDIPCEIVVGYLSGGSHAWNMVQLNGTRYAVDVTADDPVVRGRNSVVSGAESHDFFLVGANTVIDGAAFSSSHTATGEYVTGVRFQYPALSPEAYGAVSGSGEDPWEPDDPDDPGYDAWDSPFLDIPADAYYYDAVQWAYYAEPQVTNGIDDTHFGPESTVTRGQTVTFLWRAMGCPEPETTVNKYEDVKESDYYYKAILWAVENNITLGTDDTHFSPAQTCSTAHIITFLYRAMGIATDGWYEEAAAWAKNAGLLNGIDLEVSPSVNCPRADVVLYLYRELAK